jgi:hypothetical protein
MRLVRCNVNDGADYDFIHESAVQTTFKKYFEWSENNDVPVDFTRSFIGGGSGLMIIVDAKFKHKEDEAQFVLTFGNKVYNTIKELGNMDYEFGYRNN